MDNKDLLKAALKIGADWDIDWHEVQHGKQRLDLWLVPAGSRGWFGGRRWKCGNCGHNIRLRDADRRKRWRHLNIGTLASYLNVGVECEFDCPECGSSHNLVSWAEPGADLTREMEQRVANAICRLPDISDVCQILGVGIDEALTVQQKLGLKPGNAGAEAPARTKTPSAMDEDASWLPGDDHPAWTRVIDGSLALKTDALPLQFMLNRLRLQHDPNAPPEKRHAQARQLRAYFTKYRHQSTNELRQIFG
ncbi:MAG: hypothetical protein KJ558_08535 [Gammaproteobacteria bacterium]|nr:hypothetical protein [Gammaproteobacteria bacterium]MBU1654857.1 hypothetical protein [Gammaproteobacteria bacterium]MBU1961148.1 hypothetical protein [Gammaproteobacteria bacterium]